MADYYPLISKAVADLDPDAPRESRRTLYERARVALLDQLRTVDPPFSEAQIAREQLALEEAVLRVEGEATQRAPRFPTLNDLVNAADDIAKTTAEPNAPNQKPNEISVKAIARAPSMTPPTPQPEPPAMTVTGTATGRLNRIWRWRSLSPARSTGADRQAAK
jgi:hypothetical protein